jgi:hypothetical protein
LIDVLMFGCNKSGLDVDLFTFHVKSVDKGEEDMDGVLVHY